MAELRKLYNPKDEQMQVAGFMSGSGTNLRKIIEFERQLARERGKSPYRVAVIFSDNSESNAPKIGKDFDVPVIIRDKIGFYDARGKPLKDMAVRAEFDEETVQALLLYHIDVAAYAGYMSKATPVLINAFLGINVHPADLSVKTPDGRRKYTGDRAVAKAIVAGEKYICSTVHIVEEKVDYGRILRVSAPLEVVLEGGNPACPEFLEQIARKNQDKLKEKGDWVIFPQTLLDIAEGRFAEGLEGRLFYNGVAIPDGVRLD